MEHKREASPPPAERAALYDILRDQGENPDEAAQGAGYKNFKSAYTGLLNAGIRISSRNGVHCVVIGSSPKAEPCDTPKLDDIDAVIEPCEPQDRKDTPPAASAPVIDIPEGRCTMDDVVDMIRERTGKQTDSAALKHLVAITFRGTTLRYEIGRNRQAAWIFYGDDTTEGFALSKSEVLDTANELLELANMLEEDA